MADRRTGILDMDGWETSLADLYTAANSALMGQGPKVLAAGRTAGDVLLNPFSIGQTGQIYNKKLQEEAAMARAIADQSTMAGIPASILGGLATGGLYGKAATLPSALKNIALATGEGTIRGHTDANSDLGSAFLKEGASAGAATSILEAVPFLGKVFKGGGEFLKSASIGQKRNAAEKAAKATGKVGITKGAFDEIIEEFKTNPKLEEFSKNYNAVISGQSSRVKALQDASESLIKDRMTMQTRLVQQAQDLVPFNLANSPEVFNPTASLQKALQGVDQADIAAFTRTYLKRLENIPGAKLIDGELVFTKKVTPKSLLKARQKISGYKATATTPKDMAIKAVYDDLNESLAKAIDLADVEKIGAGAAFREAGQSTQALIKLKETLPETAKQGLGALSDITRQITAGAPAAAVGYTVAGLTPEQSIALGFLASTKTGAGGLGAAASKFGDVIEKIPAKQLAAGARGLIAEDEPTDLGVITPAGQPDKGEAAPVPVEGDPFAKYFNAQPEAASPGSNAAPQEDPFAKYFAPQTATPPVSPTNSAPLPAEEVAMGGVLSPKAQKVVAAAKKAGIDLSVFQDSIEAAQIYEESGFNPTAVSNKNAQGWAQFIPSTAKRYGLTDPTDLTQALTARRAYMQDLSKLYDTPALQLMGYHAGEDNMNNWLAGKPSRVGEKTLAYAPKVLSTAKELEPLFNRGNL